MDKWTAYDMYLKIGQFYAQKMRLFREAFTIYANGYSKAKALLCELKHQSKQFKLFLKETQTDYLKLETLLDLPLIHMQQTMDIFKQIRCFTYESKKNPAEVPHIDSVILLLRSIFSNLNKHDINHIETMANVRSNRLNMTTATTCNLDYSIDDDTIWTKFEQHQIFDDSEMMNHHFSDDLESLSTDSSSSSFETDTCSQLSSFSNNYSSFNNSTIYVYKKGI
jgi:hypothetical protein